MLYVILSISYSSSAPAMGVLHTSLTSLQATHVAPTTKTWADILLPAGPLWALVVGVCISYICVCRLLCVMRLVCLAPRTLWNVFFLNSQYQTMQHVNTTVNWRLANVARSVHWYDVQVTLCLALLPQRMVFASAPFLQTVAVWCNANWKLALYTADMS